MLDVILSCAVLFVLAVAQPLLDLLGRNAEFFLARATPPIDIVLLALFLTFGIPVFIGLFVAGVRNLHAPTGTVLHWIVLSILGGILALQVISRTPAASFPAWLEIDLAVGVRRVPCLRLLPLRTTSFGGALCRNRPNRGSRVVPLRILGVATRVRIR